MKFFVRTLLLLVIVNGLLLYMHYSSSGNATAKDHDNLALSYAQEIEVTNRADGLYIRHHFSELSTNEYEIIWPESSTNRSCYLEDTAACSRMDEFSASFSEGEEERQSIMYVIPKDKPMEQSILFEKVFATLKDSEPTSNLLHLTDEMGIGGLWVNGLELIGNKEMALIDYSLFSGYGEITDLYWQSNIPPLIYEGEKLSVFGTDSNIEAFDRAESTLKSTNLLHKTIVMDAGKKPLSLNRFSITNELNADNMVNSLIVNQLIAYYSIPQEEQLTAELVASLLSGKPIGIEKTTVVYDALVESLTKEELEKLISKLGNMGNNPVSASILDEAIGEIVGYNTSFINKNTKESAFFPFLLEDPRKVHVEGEESPNTAVIIKDGKTLYPATKIMKELGFDINVNDQSLYFVENERSFRFPLNEPFYVYNDRKYNLQSVPFVRIGDEFYFEEVPFIRIFILGIDKTAERIDIIPRAKFEGAKTSN